MTKLHYQLLNLLTHIFPCRVELDGADNSVTVNDNLYQLLKHLGIEDNNNIIGFRIGKEDGINTRYAFELCPTDINPTETITSPLMYNEHYRTFGFELRSPSVQKIFYDWGLDHDSIFKTVCLPRLSPGKSVYLEIVR